ncbi:MAG: DUF1844 domain-containing protein [Armatimonadota bacterium]
MAEEEKTHEFKDKRRVNPDGTLKEEAQAEPEKPEQEAEETPLPDVYDTLRFMLGMFVEQAWQFMGLHLPPGRKEPVVDLEQAKIAIDSIVFVADKLQPHLSEDEQKALRGLIGDLQLNFVQKSQ